MVVSNRYGIKSKRNSEREQTERREAGNGLRMRKASTRPQARVRHTAATQRRSSAFALPTYAESVQPLVN